MLIFKRIPTEKGPSLFCIDPSDRYMFRIVRIWGQHKE